MSEFKTYNQERLLDFYDVLAKFLHGQLKHKSFAGFTDEWEIITAVIECPTPAIRLQVTNGPNTRARTVYIRLEEFEMPS